MAIPIKYRNTSEQSIATYDFIDITTGRGVISLYGMDYKIGTLVSYALTSDAVYADEASTQTAASTTKTAVFESKFQKQVTFVGDLLVNVPYRVQQAGSETVSCAITLSKSDGTTETTIATASAALTKNFGAGEPRVFNMKTAITKTTINPNDTLRLSVRYQSPTGKTIDWFHDPKNRSTINGTAYSLETSQLAAHIQTMIDL